MNEEKYEIRTSTTAGTTVVDPSGKMIGWQDKDGTWHWENDNSKLTYDPNMPGPVVDIGTPWQNGYSWSETGYPYMKTPEGDNMNEVD